MKTMTIYNQDVHLYPIVVSMPHSGTWIPDSMKAQLIKGTILPNMDWYIPLLYCFLKDMNITMIENHVSRYVIDPNRPLELEGSNNYKTDLIYTHTTLGYPMYQQLLNKEEIQERIDLYYKPYHETLKQLIDEKKKYFSKVYLIDLHSFGADMNCDIIIGNRKGQTMNQQLFSFVHQQLEKQGFKVIDNEPFQGGFITRHYASQDVETLQIEIVYKKYIADRYFGNEELPTIDESLMNHTRTLLQQFFKAFIQYIERK